MYCQAQHQLQLELVWILIQNWSKATEGQSLEAPRNFQGNFIGFHNRRYVSYYWDQAMQDCELTLTEGSTFCRAVLCVGRGAAKTSLFELDKEHIWL